MRTIQIVLVLLLFLAIAAYAQDDLTELRRQAEQGDATAQFKLGVMYLDGQGVTQSDSEAVMWFRKAAEYGNSDAQYNLGEMYSDGRGVSPDDSEAVKWFRKAAQQGHRLAYYTLREPSLYLSMSPENKKAHQLLCPVILLSPDTAHSILTSLIVKKLNEMNIKVSMRPSEGVEFDLLPEEWDSTLYLCFLRGRICQSRIDMILKTHEKIPWGHYESEVIGYEYGPGGTVYEKVLKVWIPEGEEYLNVDVHIIDELTHKILPDNYTRTFEGSSRVPDIGGRFELNASPEEIAFKTAEEIRENLSITQKLIDNTLNNKNWVSAFDSHDDAEKLKIIGKYAYLFTHEGIQIIDIASPQAPRGIGKYTSTWPYCLDGIISGNYAFESSFRCTGNSYTSNLDVIDITNPRNPILSSSLALEKKSSLPKSCTLILTVGNTLYLNRDKDFTIIDITDPKKLHKAGSFKVGALITDAKIVGNFIYVMTEKNLQIFDLTNPQKPCKIGHCRIRKSPSCFEVVGNHAIIAYRKNLQIVDITDAKTPLVVGNYESSHNIYNWYSSTMALKGHYVYLASRTPALDIININDPQDPNFVDCYIVPGEIRDIEVSGNYLYVACAGIGLLGGSIQIFDITNVHRPF